MEIKFEIKKNIATLSTSPKGWTKELNLVSWDGREPKLDLRDWSPDHAKMGKGVCLSDTEADKLVTGLVKYLAKDDDDEEEKEPEPKAEEPEPKAEEPEPKQKKPEPKVEVPEPVERSQEEIGKERYEFFTKNMDMDEIKVIAKQNDETSLTVIFLDKYRKLTKVEITGTSPASYVFKEK